MNHNARHEGPSLRRRLRDKVAWRRSRPLWLAALLIVLFAVGYTLSQHKKAPPPQRITIAFSTAPESALVIVAAQRGYLRDEGLDAELVPFLFGKAAMDAMLRGEAEFATATETPITLAILQGQALSIVAGIATSERNVGVVARRDRGIARAQDLRGKRVGATLGNNTQYFVHALLSVEGIPKDDVTVLFQPPDRLAESLLAGNLDAVSVWHPFLLTLQQALGDKGVTFYGGHIYTETFVATSRQAYVAGHPQQVRAFLRALGKAEAFVRDRPEAAREMVAQATGWKRGLLDEVWAHYRFRLGLAQAMVITMENEAQWAIAAELTRATTVPNFLEFIHVAGLQSVAPGRVTVTP